MIAETLESEVFLALPLNYLFVDTHNEQDVFGALPDILGDGRNTLLFRRVGVNGVLSGDFPGYGLPQKTCATFFWLMPPDAITIEHYAKLVERLPNVKTLGHTNDELSRINFNFPERPIIHGDQWILTLLEMLARDFQPASYEMP